MTPRWPVPLGRPAEDPAPERHGDPGKRPSLEARGDGSRWLDADGEVRRVAPPGTDHREQRFATRSLPAWNEAAIAARGSTEQGTSLEITTRVHDAAEGDDLALLAAAEQAAHGALKRVVRQRVDPSSDEARVALRTVEILRAAHAMAARRLDDPTGYEAFDEATARWRARHG